MAKKKLNSHQLKVRARNRARRKLEREAAKKAKED